jgi:signal transduction histidine kinase
LDFLLRDDQGGANLLDSRFLFTSLATLNQHIAESGEKRLIELLAEDVTSYDELTKGITGIEAQAAMEECLDLTTRIVTHLDELVELNERGMERAELETRRLAERAQRQSIILILATIALILLLSYGLSSYVARPIRELALRLADSSRGGERYPVLPLKGDDEITLLTAEFNRLFRSLAEYDRHNADILAGEKTKVRQAEEAKARFIADLSHQLKTPMTSLGGAQPWPRPVFGESTDLYRPADVAQPGQGNIVPLAAWQQHLAGRAETELSGIEDGKAEAVTRAGKTPRRSGAPIFDDRRWRDRIAGGTLECGQHPALDADSDDPTGECRCDRRFGLGPSHAGNQHTHNGCSDDQRRSHG